MKKFITTFLCLACFSCFSVFAQESTESSNNTNPNYDQFNYNNTVGLIGISTLKSGALYYEHWFDKIGFKFIVGGNYRTDEWTTVSNSIDKKEIDLTAQLEYKFFDYAFSDKTGITFSGWGSLGYVGYNSCHYISPVGEPEELGYQPGYYKENPFINNFITSCGIEINLRIFKFAKIPLMMGMQFTFPNETNASVCGGIGLGFCF